MATLKASQRGLERIKQARHHKGWAVNDFRWLEAASEVLGMVWAEKGVLASGISEGTWKRFLTGKLPINAEAFKAYCRVLEVDWQEVMEGVEARSQEPGNQRVGSQELGEREVDGQGRNGRGLGSYEVGSAVLGSAILESRVRLSIAEDWSDAPDAAVFYGRQAESEVVRQWLLRENCRLITLLGMGGIGKTTLSVRLAREIAAVGMAASDDNGADSAGFQFVFWRSLRNAPTIEDILADLLQFLSQQQETELPERWESRVTRLLHYLRNARCLLILDNVESILQAGDRNGRYREGYEGYGQFFRSIAETQHASCLVLTSREKPYGLVAFEGESLPVRSLQLTGLSESEGRKLFDIKGTFTATPVEWEILISRYAGNPLALKIVASSINDYFSGSVSDFLEITQHTTFLFDDIHNLIDQHFQRLTELETAIMYWLAINREPVTLAELQADFVAPVPLRELLESLNSLQRRSLIEKSGTGFSQQPVVMEYVIHQLIQRLCQEIATQEIQLFSSHALIEAQAKDYVRETQIQLILQPIIQQLLIDIGSPESIKAALNQMLSTLRGQPSKVTGYAAGNALNLLYHAQIELTGFDCSDLTVWQAYLQGIPLHEVNFTRSALSRCVFTETLGNILAADFSPDGRLLATCDTDCQIRLWDVVTGKLVLICQGHTNWVRNVAFSPDGHTLASCGADRTIKLWSVPDGICLKTLTGHAHEVFAIAFDPDGYLLASSSGDCTIKIWDTQAGTCLQTLTGHSNWIRTVAFSRDRTTLASGSEDQTIKLWDIDQGECLSTWTEHTAGVKSVAFSPDGTQLMSGSGDRTLKLWDVKTQTCVRTYSGHQSSIYAVAFSPQGDFLITGSGDHTIKLWDVNTDQCLKTLHGHKNEVYSISVSSDNQTLVSASLDQSAKLWNWQTGICLRSLQGHTDWSFPITFSPNGAILASGSDDQTVRIWDWQTSTCLKILKGHSAYITATAFINDRIVASGSRDNTARIWDIGTGQCLQVLHGHGDWIFSVAAGGNRVITSSADRTIKVWNWQTGQCLLTLNGHTDQVLTVACSRDGQKIASGSTDRTVRIWDARTGDCLQVLEGHDSRVMSVAFSADDRAIASGSTDQTVRLWDVEQGHCLQTLTGHVNWVFAVGFSPDGRYLASAASDRTVRLWDAETGICLQACTGHAHVVSSVAFHPKADLLASSSQDQTIRIWDINQINSQQVLIVKRLYEGLKIREVKGLTPATIATLQTLGAVVQ